MRRLLRRADERLRAGAELLDVAASALVEHLEREAAEVAEAVDRRRRERDHQATLDAEQRAADPRQQALDALLGLLALGRTA